MIFSRNKMFSNHYKNSIFRLLSDTLNFHPCGDFNARFTYFFFGDCTQQFDAFPSVNQLSPLAQNSDEIMIFRFPFSLSEEDTPARGSNCGVFSRVDVLLASSFNNIIAALEPRAEMSWNVPLIYLMTVIFCSYGSLKNRGIEINGAPFTLWNQWNISKDFSIV